MDVLFPYALWTLVSLIVIGSGIALNWSGDVHPPGSVLIPSLLS
jgi:hypothetical protein